jgi:hypothetical protein
VNRETAVSEGNSFPRVAVSDSTQGAQTRKECNNDAAVMVESKVMSVTCLGGP